MKYWIVTFDEKDYLISSSRGFDVIGLPDQSRWEKMVKQMSVGDKVIAYASGISHFGAVLEVTREYFNENSKIWDRNDELWPHRFETKLLYELPIEKHVDAKTIIMEMETPSSDQKQPQHWALFLRGSMRPITHKDYTLIVERMAKANDDNPEDVWNLESADFIEPTEKEEIEYTQKIKLPRSIEEAEKEIIRISKEISNEPVKERIKIAKILSRNKMYSSLVKERVEFICEICGARPFIQKNGKLYAEAHHKFELSKTRIDTPQDMICVCAQCHRVIHYGDEMELNKRMALKNKYE